MKLTTYHGAYTVRCLTCGTECNGYSEHVYADLDGEPFKAYHHAKCLTGEQIAEGLARMQQGMADSMARDHERNANRYHGD